VRIAEDPTEARADVELSVFHRSTHTIVRLRGRGPAYGPAASDSGSLEVDGHAHRRPRPFSPPFGRRPRASPVVVTSLARTW
jgi:hypothetical protein